MSAGYFNRIQLEMKEAAIQIEQMFNKQTSGFSSKTLSRMRKTVNVLRKATQMVDRVDYLLSADDDEETFNEKWEKESL